MDYRIAAYADVHADAPALRAILRDIKAAGIERVWCLGDFCSGGPDPVECFDLTEDACEVVLAGNHEMFVALKLFEGYSGAWMDSARLAYHKLGARNTRLRRLEPHALMPEAELVHGALGNDPASAFIVTPKDAARSIARARRSLLLYGHTHKIAYWARREQQSGFELRTVELERRYALPEGRCALNPGAGCDADGGTWLEISSEDGKRYATWHRTDVAGHGGITSATP